MKSVVITGSTRGIGYGLADAFLGLGCTVTVSGRAQASADKAAEELAVTHPADRILAHACDVTRYEQVQGLWDAARERFGRVDIWINNAGVSQRAVPVWELDPEQVQTIVQTNITGSMYGAAVAMSGMIEQGAGAIYNLEGFGSDGRKMSGLSIYGTSKYGLVYLTDALVEEAKGTPVLVGAIRPGMVVTDLLVKQPEQTGEEWERSKRAFNILADRVETVTPYLAEKVLENERRGARIKWLSSWQVMWRFMTARWNKRDLFAD